MVESKNPPKSSLKIWLIPVYCIFTLLLVFVLLATFIDLERFHEPLASRLSKATGWNVQMESLSLDFTHGLGVKCVGLRVRSKDKSRDLFFAEKMYLVAELRPLLKKQLKIKKATIIQPVIKIYLESPGQEPPPVPDPKQTVESQQPPEKHSEFPTPELPPVSGRQEPVEDQISKKPSDKKVEFNEFKELLKKKNLRLQIIEIHQGKVILIDPSSQSSRGQEVPINVSLRLEFEQLSPQRVDVVIDSLELGIGDLLFQGGARVEDLLASQSKVTADLKSGSISLTQLKGLGKFLPDFKFPKELEKGNIEHVSIHLDAPFATMDTLDALKQKARLDFTFKIKDAVYRKNEWSILLPRLSGEGTWKNNLLTQKIDGEVFGGKFQEKGVVRFSQTPQGVRTVFLDSEVNLSGLDLALLNYPRKEEWIPLKGKADGSFRIKGPITLSEKVALFDSLHWNGTFEGENLVLASQDSLRQVAHVNVAIKEGTPELIPLEVNIDQFKIQDIAFKKAKGIFNVKPETLELIKGTIWPEHGELQLAGTYNRDRDIYSLDILGKNLRAEDFSQNALNGPASFSGKFKGRMTPEKSSQKTDYDHFTHGLSGNFHIHTSNGTIQELGDLEPLLSVLNLTTSIGKKENGIEYKFIGGDFKIFRGLLVTDNFIIEGPQLKMSIVGKAELPDGKVDAEITAMPLQILDSVVKLVPGLGGFLTGGKKGGLLVTHCLVTGTLENPEFKLQPHKSATKIPTDIFKGIINLPNGLLNSK